MFSGFSRRRVVIGPSVSDVCFSTHRVATVSDATATLSAVRALNLRRFIYVTSRRKWAENV